MKAVRTALYAVGAASLAAAIWTTAVAASGKLIYFAGTTGERLRAAAAVCLLVCAAGLFAARPKKEGSGGRSVVLGITLAFSLIAAAGAVAFAGEGLGKADLIKSPDGERIIVRKKTSDWFGNTKYNFYVKEKGAVYRYIFDSDEEEPDIVWTDYGAEYRGERYEF